MGTPWATSSWDGGSAEPAEADAVSRLILVGTELHTVRGGIQGQLGDQQLGGQRYGAGGGRRGEQVDVGEDQAAHRKGRHPGAYWFRTLGRRVYCSEGMEVQLGNSSPLTFAFIAPSPRHTHLRVKCVLPFEGGSCHVLPSAQSSGTEAGLMPGAPPGRAEGGEKVLP